MTKLETVARYGINTVTIVNDNSVLQQSKLGGGHVYGDHVGNNDELTAFQRLNFIHVAEDLGCRGTHVEQPANIALALAEAFTETRPVVVGVVTDPDFPAPESWTPPEVA